MKLSEKKIKTLSLIPEKIRGCELNIINLTEDILCMKSLALRGEAKISSILKLRAHKNK